MPVLDSLELKVNFYYSIGEINRMRILQLLQQHEELTMGEIQEAMGFIQTKTSRHLAYLRKAKLVLTRTERKYVYYRINPAYREEINRCL